MLTETSAPVRRSAAKAHPRLTGRAVYMTSVLGVAFALCAVSAFAGVRGIPVVLLLAAVLLGPLARPSWATTREIALLAALVAFAAVSLAWAPAPERLFAPHGLEHATVFKLALIVAASAVLVWGARRLGPRAAAIDGLAAAIALTALSLVIFSESLTDAALYQSLLRLTHRHHPLLPLIVKWTAERDSARGAYLLALLIWPAAVLFWRRKLPLLVLPMAAAILGAKFGLDRDTPAIALVGGGLVFAAVLALGRMAVIAAGAASCAGWFAAPWLVKAVDAAGLAGRIHSHLPLSWSERLDIWKLAVARISTRPLVGWGIDARSLIAPNVAHPHCAPIQYWLELGLPGALISTAVIGSLWLRIGRESSRAVAASASASLTAFVIVSAVSFNAWEEWWLCMGLLAVLTALLLRSRSKRG